MSYVLLNPVVLASAIALLGVAGYFMVTDVARSSERFAIQSVTEDSIRTIHQFRVLRKYYTQNVVDVATKHDLKIGIDHRGIDDTIPLPATMIHDMSDLLADQVGIRLDLYSAYPFPGRAQRELDDFQRGAIEVFDRGERDMVVEYTNTTGAEAVRVAIADRMVDQTCVNCHNTHPDTPKKGWKIGDIRGVLEVTQPIAPEMAEIRSNTRQLYAFVVAVVLLFLTPMVGYVLVARSGMQHLIHAMKDRHKR